MSSHFYSLVYISNEEKKTNLYDNANQTILTEEQSLVCRLLSPQKSNKCRPIRLYTLESHKSILYTLLSSKSIIVYATVTQISIVCSSITQIGIVCSITLRSHKSVFYTPRSHQSVLYTLRCHNRFNAQLFVVLSYTQRKRTKLIWFYSCRTPPPPLSKCRRAILNPSASAIPSVHTAWEI